MIFNSNILPMSALFMLYIGLVMGIMYEIILFVTKLTKHNKFVICVLDIIFALALCSAFIFGVQYCNYGKFRLFLLVTYIFAFVIERTTLGDLVAKFINLIYNLVIKLINKGVDKLHNDRKKT